MSRPESDRERALRLEAENAALREELAAWQAADDAAPRDDSAGLHRLTERLRPFMDHPTLAARTLAYLAGRPGRVTPGWRVGEAIAVRETEQPDMLAKVGVVLARKGLKALAPALAIQTAWGQGYVMERACAEQVKAWMEPADG